MSHSGALFEDLGAPHGRRSGLAGAVASLVAHVAIGSIVLALPLLVSEPLPRLLEEQRVVFLYDPPPPPPPPPLRGSTSPAAQPRVVQQPAPTPLPESASRAPEPVETAGDAQGSDTGSPEGMEGGVEGGSVGGIPGGVLGGVIGGTGTGPVPWTVPLHDQPPRPLSTPKPVYPHEAFAKKIEGIVTLEILIDERGRVAEARVLNSIPLLDQAALDAVRAWRFQPATRAGRPVAALARAPITFRIL